MAASHAPGAGDSAAETAARAGGSGGSGASGGVPRAAARLPDYADRVLTAVEQIPPGRVATYGDIAALLRSGGPRQVGTVMARYGGAVPWWRVVRADGALLPGHEREALEHYRTEGTPLRPGGTPRIDLRRARWTGPEHADTG
ncbi:MGMT family protein [Streptomyces aidingensis]